MVETSGSAPKLVSPAEPNLPELQAHFHSVEGPKPRTKSKINKVSYVVDEPTNIHDVEKPNSFRPLLTPGGTNHFTIV